MNTVNRSLAAVFLLLAAILIFNGCAPKTSGAVKDDSSLTGISEELKPDGEYTGPKLRVGVVNFQNNTPSQNIGVGAAAADILGTILQKTERFIVIPQQDMKSIMDQQALGASGAIDPASTAEMGKVLGLNAIVTGAVLPIPKRKRDPTSWYTRARSRLPG